MEFYIVIIISLLAHTKVVGKCNSKQQICVLDGIRLHCAKNWTYTPSASVSYGKQAGRPAGENLIILIFNVRNN